MICLLHVAVSPPIHYFPCLFCNLPSLYLILSPYFHVPPRYSNVSSPFPFSQTSLTPKSESAFDEQHSYDSKSTRANRKSPVVHLKCLKKLVSLVKPEELQEHQKRGGALEHMQALNSRVIVSKVRKEEWEFVCGLAGVDAATL